MADLMAVADAGEVMPPKSTWFEPKIRSGLVSALLHPDLVTGGPREDSALTISQPAIKLASAI